jgi:hypothetical protein
VNDPDADLDLRQFGSLKEATLPQLDKVLLWQIQTFAVEAAKDPGTDVKAHNEVVGARISLNQKTLLAARYASAAIYAPMLTLYQRYSAKWDSDQRGAMLTYLLRWNAAKTMPLLRAAETPDDNPFSGVLATVGKVYSYIPKPFPPELRADLREKVAHGPYPEIMTAALELSMHGLPEDEAVIRKRLSQVQAELKAESNLHPEKLDDPVGNGAATGPLGAESALIGALQTNMVWHLTESELIALKQDCLGAFCRQMATTPRAPLPPGY